MLTLCIIHRYVLFSLNLMHLRASQINCLFKVYLLQYTLKTSLTEAAVNIPRWDAEDAKEKHPDPFARLV